MPSELELLEHWRRVESWRVAHEKIVVHGVEPLLNYRTKATFFSPRNVSIEAAQTPGGTWTIRRVMVYGPILKDGEPIARTGAAYYNNDTERLCAPVWLYDYMQKLLTELVELYPANT